MRIFPLVLIAIGGFGVLKHYGLIDPAFVHLFWPVLLIGIGVALLVRGPRWRSDMRERMQDRWERRMHRHFGPGWANLSDEERERFRAGMRQWRSPGQPLHRATRADACLSTVSVSQQANHLNSELIVRVFPIALIVIGSLGVAKYLGLIPAGMGPLIGPLLLIALGMALLFRRPRRCRDGWSGRGGRGNTAAPQSPSGGLV